MVKWNYLKIKGDRRMNMHDNIKKKSVSIWMEWIEVQINKTKQDFK